VAEDEKLRDVQKMRKELEKTLKGQLDQGQRVNLLKLASIEQVEPPRTHRSKSKKRRKHPLLEPTVYNTQPKASHESRQEELPL